MAKPHLKIALLVHNLIRWAFQFLASCRGDGMGPNHILASRREWLRDREAYQPHSGADENEARYREDKCFFGHFSHLRWVLRLHGTSCLMFLDRLLPSPAPEFRIFSRHLFSPVAEALRSSPCCSSFPSQAACHMQSVAEFMEV